MAEYFIRRRGNDVIAKLFRESGRSLEVPEGYEQVDAETFTAAQLPPDPPVTLRTETLLEQVLQRLDARALGGTR